jgi:hypothetical protein
MALTVKILEKGAGTKARTKIACLGGLITSESTGYTPTNCTAALQTASQHYWACSGTAGTEAYVTYPTATACVSGHKIYVTARMNVSASGVNLLSLVLGGTTGGSVVIDDQASPVSDTFYTLSGIATLDGTFTGNLKIVWDCYDLSGVTGEIFRFFEWVAIDLTAQFGAGDEPSVVDLDAFFAWRFLGCVYSNYALYNSYGDTFHYASKIASHGLAYNDVVLIDNGVTIMHPFSNVFPLNANWIITSTYMDDYGDAVVSVEYWTQVDYTSRLLAKSLRANLRNDIDGGCSLSFRGDATWQPKTGMTLFVYDGTEVLFSGHIAVNSKVEMNTTNWRCDCQVAPMLAALQWTFTVMSDSSLAAYTSTRHAVDKIVFDYANYGCNYRDDNYGGQCFWRGNIDTGNADLSLRDAYLKPAYDAVDSLCKDAALVLSCSPDRRLSAQYQTRTVTNAPRNIKDGDTYQASNPRYTEDISKLGNIVVINGGYDATGAQVLGLYTAASPITEVVYAGYSKKLLVVSDSNITNATEAATAGAFYVNRYGKVLPGEFSFTSTDLDYRPGQKIEILLASLGITSTLYMHVDDVELYDVDGVNLLVNVTCSNRDSVDFAAAPNKGTNSQIGDLATRSSNSITALTQTASTFTPALFGSTGAGTWAWTTQWGYYVLHGSVCYVAICLNPSSISGSPTGNLRLSGLPFTVASHIPNQMLHVLASGVNWGTSKSQIQVVLTAGETNGTFYGSGNDLAMATVSVANILAGDNLIINGWYQITP